MLRERLSDVLKLAEDIRDTMRQANALDTPYAIGWRPAPREEPGVYWLLQTALDRTLAGYLGDENSERAERVREETQHNGESVAYNLRLFGWHHEHPWVPTDEQIGGMLADGKLTPDQFGLAALEVRRYGACHPSKLSPCEHDENTDTLMHDVYYAAADDRANVYGVPHSEQTCRSAWDIGGDTEGIGGEYVDGGTFSYLSDDAELSTRIRAAAVVVGIRY